MEKKKLFIIVLALLILIGGVYVFMYHRDTIIKVEADETAAFYTNYYLSIPKGIDVHKINY